NDTHVGISTSDLDRFIIAPAIQDNYVTGPLKLLERARDVRSLVAGQDYRGDLVEHNLISLSRLPGWSSCRLVKALICPLPRHRPTRPDRKASPANRSSPPGRNDHRPGGARFC